MGMDTRKGLVDFTTIAKRAFVWRFACPHVLNKTVQIKVQPHFGSLDPDGNPIGSNSPTVNTNSTPLEAVEEEKKE